jgi:CheY-like chemotaxis protein
MNGQMDFQQMRMLLVGGKPAAVQVLRTAFGMLGLRHVMVIAESARAIEALRCQQFSAIFCDATAERFEGMTFAVAARRTPGVVNPMTPLFMICTLARQHQVEQARDIGVTDVLTHPVSATTIARKLSSALKAPRPFIVAPSFFGPDRRTRRPPAWDGNDRRTRIAKKTRLAVADDSDKVYV